MNHAIELKVAYLAGVMDSDGYFTIHKNARTTASPIYSSGFGINQVESEAIILARDTFGGTIKMIDYTKAYTQGKRFSNKPMYYWVCPASMQKSVLEALIPLLRIKRKQAEILLRLRKDIEFYPRTGGRESSSLPPQAIEFREKLYQELRGLRHSPVAETERESSSDEEKRQSDLHGNMQSAAEMTAPAE